MNIQARDIRKHRLVDSAKLAFADRGYHETSISEIVRQAGIARSTFYQYFDSKLHLFESILESFLQDLHESIEPISVTPGSAPTLIQIQDNLARVLNLVLEEGDLTRMLMHNTGALDRTMVRRLEDFYSQAAGMIQRSLTRGVSMNLVRPCDTTIVSYSIIGAVKEVIFQLSTSKDVRPSTPDLVSQLLDFAMGGILVQSQNPLARLVR